MLYWFFVTDDGKEFDTLGTARDHATHIGGKVVRITLNKGVLTQKVVCSAS